MPVRLDGRSDNELAKAVREFNTRYGEIDAALWCVASHSRAALLKHDEAPVFAELIWAIRVWWGVQGAPLETKSAMAKALLTLEWSPDEQPDSKIVLQH
jgi:hypothetical protein